MARLPYQVLAYIRRRLSSDRWEYPLLKRTTVRGGFWQGVSGGLYQLAMTRWHMRRRPAPGLLIGIHPTMCPYDNASSQGGIRGR